MYIPEIICWSNGFPDTEILLIESGCPLLGDLVGDIFKKKRIKGILLTNWVVINQLLWYNLEIKLWEDYYG